MNLMLSLMVLASLTMMMLKHPLSMGLILIIQTLMTSIIAGYIMSSFLFSYIIIIIMLSGALVLFIYMASVANNEKFKTPIMNIMIMMSLFFFIIIMLNIMSKSYINNNLMMVEEISLIKLFNTLTSQMTLMAIMYLLLTMIVVSNNAKVIEGPLRMKSNYE